MAVYGCGSVGMMLGYVLYIFSKASNLAENRCRICHSDHVSSFSLNSPWTVGITLYRFIMLFYHLLFIYLIFINLAGHAG